MALHRESSRSVGLTIYIYAAHAHIYRERHAACTPKQASNLRRSFVRSLSPRTTAVDVVDRRRATEPVAVAVRMGSFLTDRSIFAVTATRVQTPRGEIEAHAHARPPAARRRRRRWRRVARPAGRGRDRAPRRRRPTLLLSLISLTPSAVPRK